MLRSKAALIALCVFVSGCAAKSKVVRDSPVFQPTPGNSLIVLYRNTVGYMGMGAQVNSTLTINAKLTSPAFGTLTR